MSDLCMDCKRERHYVMASGSLLCNDCQKKMFAELKRKYGGNDVTKLELVKQCMDDGIEKPKEIAEKTGLPLSSVYTYRSQIKKDVQDKAPEEDTEKSISELKAKQNYDEVVAKERLNSEKVERPDDAVEPPFTMNDEHMRLCHELNKLYRAKNSDYGDSFSKSISEWGMMAAAIQMDHKMNRIKQLIKSGKREVKSESIRDNLVDIANYALMGIMEVDKQ